MPGLLIGPRHFSGKDVAGRRPQKVILVTIMCYTIICNISNNSPRMAGKGWRDETVSAASFGLVDLAVPAFPAPRIRTVLVEDLLKTEATKLGLCQVGSKTDHPCLRLAVVEIRGVPFCEQCAREQQSYFAIGEMSLN